MPGERARLFVRARVNADASAEADARPRLDASFEVDATSGAVTAITGPSGAGKTTLLHVVAGLVRPAAGRIVLDGEVLFDAEARVWVAAHRRRVALVLQSIALLPHLPVWRNVAYGLRGVARGRRRAVALDWLRRARAEALADRAPATLSGGEAQRVALARALASEPRLILLDEPFSALDRALRVELGEVLRDLLAATRTPALLVTHDLTDVDRLAQRVLVLEAGRLVREETAPRAAVAVEGEGA